MIQNVGDVYGVAFSSDSRWLVSGFKDGSAQLRELSTGQLVHRLIGHNYAVRAFAFSHDNSRLISGGGTGRLGFWDVQSGECFGLIGEFEIDMISDGGKFGDGGKYRIRRICLSPQEDRLDITDGTKVKHKWTKQVPLRLNSLSHRAF